MSTYYTIGQVASQLQIPPSTLRYYDREGLLPFVARSEGGVRMFRQSDLEWLSLIECLKHTGMPLKDIRTFIDWCMAGDETIGQRLEIIQRQKQAVEEQIAALQEVLGVLQYKTWYYETAQEAGSCSIHDHLTPEDVPEHLRRWRCCHTD